MIPSRNGIISVCNSRSLRLIHIKQYHVFMSSLSDPYGVAPSSGAMNACLITLGIFSLNQSHITFSQHGYSAINTQICVKQRVTEVNPPQ